MKLGEVIAKERTARRIAPDDMAGRLNVPLAEYQALERGESDAEVWGPRLAALAVALETPTAHLLAESGRAADAAEGQAGRLIARHRTERNLTVESMAAALAISPQDYQAIERGGSPIERIGPQLLRIAEIIDQPVFNLFYPCGLPFDTLEDYP